MKLFHDEEMTHTAGDVTTILCFMAAIALVAFVLLVFRVDMKGLLLLCL